MRTEWRHPGFKDMRFAKYIYAAAKIWTYNLSRNNSERRKFGMAT